MARKQSNIFGAAAVTREVPGGFECAGVMVASDGYQGIRTSLERGEYYVRDGSDISLIITLLGGSWKVYLSGSIPILAVSENQVLLKSLHRLGSLSDYGLDENEDERAFTCYVVAKQLRAALQNLGARPEDGLSSAVRRLAPGLGNIRRHKGIDLLARQKWLYGGRTEVFRKFAPTPVRQLDLRSAYAAAYQKGICGEFREITKKLPKKGDTFFAKVTLNIPSHCYVPPAPFRTDEGTMIFPVGKWSTWLCGPEARLCEKAGYLEKIEAVYHYEESGALSDFARHLYKVRMSTDCPVEKALCKVLLVSGYGCTAASPEFPLILVNPRDLPDGAETIAPGVYRTWQTPKFSNAHLPAAAHIASRVRASLYQGMTCHDRTLYYVDTDCVFLGEESSMIHDPLFQGGEEPIATIGLSVGDGLGQWKDCGLTPEGARFLAPKTYSLGGGAVRRAAGVSAVNVEEYLDGRTVREQKSMGFESTLAMGKQGIVPVTVCLRTERQSKREEREGVPYTIPLDVGPFL